MRAKGIRATKTALALALGAALLAAAPPLVPTAAADRGRSRRHDRGHQHVTVAAPYSRPSVVAPGAWAALGARYARPAVIARYGRPAVVARCARPVFAPCPVAVVRPRFVVAPRSAFRVVVAPERSTCRGSYADVDFVEVDGSRYYYNASFGFYLGGLALNVQVNSRPPDGYAYYDPYCGREFSSLDDYRHHLHAHSHPQALTLVRADYADND
jgi:hypothetical protein